MAEEQEKAEAELKQNPKRRKKHAFPYGNYQSYYGYRLGQKFVEDPRLKVFKKEWFEGKDCLDIGCNSGMVTIQIARKFNCRRILGVDIDPDRVDDAYRNLRRARINVGKPDNGLELGASGASKRDTEASTSISSSKEHDLHTDVSFQQQNFIFSQYPPEKHYDTILCLSVAKRIHQNWGDVGWRLLPPGSRQGGILVLEPQPLKSHEANYSVSESLHHVEQQVCYFVICLTSHFKALSNEMFGTKESICFFLDNSSQGHFSTTV
ncbi:probable RNA methyltransferase At5g51130 isoform X3 [Cucurbita pepo subsp. pepo]|uniref:probable RNA methyltransferase At5g51130 isoform X3 n=1 Tax=Cucurbita pepo subsp. pepo TaxID=3664 RepID=UPI000C9D39C6|nr:probable RNA methyltransferase At5g51130 isoform X3 [Cucurbita pepo subsp. pepo]